MGGWAAGLSKAHEGLSIEPPLRASLNEYPERRLRAVPQRIAQRHLIRNSYSFRSISNDKTITRCIYKCRVLW